MAEYAAPTVKATASRYDSDVKCIAVFSILKYPVPFEAGSTVMRKPQNQ
jgi:hypothetical protein